MKLKVGYGFGFGDGFFSVFFYFSRLFPLSDASVGVIRSKRVQCLPKPLPNVQPMWVIGTTLEIKN